jgi:hypothetical protein
VILATSIPVSILVDPTVMAMFLFTEILFTSHPIFSLTKRQQKNT